MMILTFDELDRDERPPRRIWLDAERLGEWFKEVERKRKAKYGGKGGEDRSIEDPVDNEAARSLIVG